MGDLAQNRPNRYSLVWLYWGHLLAQLLHNDFDSDQDENLKAFSLIGDLVKIENSLKGIAC